MAQEAEVVAANEAVAGETSRAAEARRPEIPTTGLIALEVNPEA